MQHSACRPGNVEGILRELSPTNRLERLKQFAESVNVDFSTNPNVYCNNGLLAVQEAEKYLRRGDYENAYVLYIKFLMISTKIKEHPFFFSVEPNTKSITDYKLADVKKKVKLLERKILNIYKEHHRHYKTEFYEEPKKRFSKFSIQAGGDSPTSTSVLEAQDITAYKHLRTVVIPNQLATIFQMFTRDTSTISYGFLGGKKINKEYVTTHLIIPKPLRYVPDYNLKDDTCCQYLEDTNLLKLGWIHTHPSSSYMSSIDMHIHHKLQCEFPEAVAIICAPRVITVEIFNLLGYGLEYIGRCSGTNSHAHHPERPIYSTAKHVKIVYGQELEVINLRHNDGSVCSTYSSRTLDSSACGSFNNTTHT